MITLSRQGVGFYTVKRYGAPLYGISVWKRPHCPGQTIKRWVIKFAAGGPSFRATFARAEREVFFSTLGEARRHLQREYQLGGDGVGAEHSREGDS